MELDKSQMVLDYLEKLKKVVDVRDQVQTQLYRAMEAAAEAGEEQEIDTARTACKKLELEIASLTAEGEFYTLKIDQLNGVR